MTTTNPIARRIAATLFTNGIGQKAVRLVLVDANGKDLGGWCENAVADQIAAVLAPTSAKEIRAHVQAMGRRGRK